MLGGHVRVGVVVRALDAAHGHRLAPLGEREQVVGQAGARGRAVALAVLAAHVLGGDEPGRGECHRAGVAVDVGHLRGLQDAVVVCRPRSPARRRRWSGPAAGRAGRSRCALRAERVERGDRQARAGPRSGRVPGRRSGAVRWSRSTRPATRARRRRGSERTRPGPAAGCGTPAGTPLARIGTPPGVEVDRPGVDGERIGSGRTVPSRKSSVNARDSARTGSPWSPSRPSGSPT